MPGLPLPPHFDPERVSEVWPVRYEDRAAEAERWVAEHDLRPAREDILSVCLVCVDVQNTFCLPEFELYVRGRSGTGIAMLHNDRHGVACRVIGCIADEQRVRAQFPGQLGTVEIALFTLLTRHPVHLR